jgi:predicted choloylglycine hydrolase
MIKSGYCKKCAILAQKINIQDISNSWNPKHPAFKIHKGHVKDYLQSKCPEVIDEVFELETKDKFKCARHVIKDIRSHHLDRIRISDYPVSIDDEDILPILQRFFN